MVGGRAHDHPRWHPTRASQVSTPPWAPRAACSHASPVRPSSSLVAAAGWLEPLDRVTPTPREGPCVPACSQEQRRARRVQGSARGSQDPRPLPSFHLTLGFLDRLEEPRRASPAPPGGRGHAWIPQTHPQRESEPRRPSPGQGAAPPAAPAAHRPAPEEPLALPARPARDAGKGARPSGTPQQAASGKELVAQARPDAPWAALTPRTALGGG